MHSKQRNKQRFYVWMVVCFIMVSTLPCSAQDDSGDAKMYIDRYESYLKSIKCYAFSYRNLLPPSGHQGEEKDNGPYRYYSLFQKEGNSTILIRETSFSQQNFQTLENSSEKGLTIYSYQDPSQMKNRPPWANRSATAPALFGYVTVYPNLSDEYIPAILRSMDLKVTHEVKNGFDAILLHGQKEGFDIQCWLDPAQQNCLRVLEMRNINAKNTGEFAYFEVRFDKFITVNGVPFPTLCYNKISQVNVDNKGILDSEFTIAFDDVDIWDESDPKPFPFVTEIPNGSKAVLLDVQQIEHIWLDGEVVPKTDEAMLALARGHKFMPGVSEPRFWLMAVGLVMLLAGGGILLRRHLKSEA